MPVDRVVTKGQDPGQVVADHITAIETNGGTLVTVILLHEEILIVYTERPKRESRAAA